MSSVLPMYRQPRSSNRWLHSALEALRTAVAGCNWIKERSPHLWPGAACSPQRTWDENGFFKCFYSMARGFLSLAGVFRPSNRGVRGAAPRLLRPMYAEANMGHPSRSLGSGYEVKSDGFRLQPNLDKSELQPSRKSAVSLRPSGKNASTRNRSLLNLLDVLVFQIT